MSYKFRGSFNFIPTSKPKSLKRDLKVWNKEIFENVAIRKEKALALIDYWDHKEKEAILSMEEVRPVKKLLKSLTSVGTNYSETKVKRILVKGR